MEKKRIMNGMNQVDKKLSVFSNVVPLFSRLFQQKPGKGDNFSRHAPPAECMSILECYNSPTSTHRPFFTFLTTVSAVHRRKQAGGAAPGSCADVCRQLPRPQRQPPPSAVGNCLTAAALEPGLLRLIALLAG